MDRALSGRLENLAPEVLLKLIASTGASGILKIETRKVSVEICFVPEGICVGEMSELEAVAQVLEKSKGSYSFTRKDITIDPDRVIIEFGEFLSAVRSTKRKPSAAFASEIDVEALVSGQVMEIAGRVDRPEIHVLAEAPTVENPLVDLLSDLEATAPDELLMVQLGVITMDPRPWRRLQREWKRRAWDIRFFGDPLDVPAEHFDLVTIHHQLSMTRVGSHDDWIKLIVRLRSEGVPVLWVGPLTDPMWVARLVDAGANFLLPAPQGDAGEVWNRFTETLSQLVDRLLPAPGAPGSETESPAAIVELVDNLLHGASTEEAVASLLQLAAVDLHCGAILVVDPTRLRCRAGFGYPLLSGGGTLPRGLGILERVIRTGESYTGIDGGSAAALQLAGALGLERLVDKTVLIPLRHRSLVVGIFIGDRGGADLSELKDLKLLASRLGGVFV